MNQIQRIISGLLALCMVFVMIPLQAVAAENVCGDNLTWTLDENGTLTISGTGAMFDYEPERDDAGELIYKAPWLGGAEIKKVVLEEGITYIGMHAFSSCDSLTEVIIPDSVTQIGSYAFSFCSNLEELILPENLKGVLEGTFSGCTSLKKITIPSGVTRIGFYTFNQCYSLEGIYFTGNMPEFLDSDSIFNGVWGTVFYPENDDTWFDGAMKDYGGLMTWASYTPPKTLPAEGVCGDNLTWTLSKDGVLTISGTGEMWDILSYEGTWRDYMEQIKRVVVEEGVQSIGENAFYNCGNMTDISLPEGLRAIGTSAFQACNALTSVNLPNTLETIGFGAFNQCSNLQTIYIPASVSNISIYAFGSCFELTGFEVDSNNQYYCNDESGVLYTKDMRKLVQATPKLSGSYEVPAGVETIAFGSFNMCVGIPSITLPESVNRIEDDAFIMWTDSQSIYFTGDAPYFGYNAFGSSTVTVYYPAGNNTWTEDVRQNYEGAVTWVSYTPGETPPAENRCGENLTWSFDETTGTLTISGTGEMYDYEGDEPWEDVRSSITKVVIESGATSIGTNAFQFCSNLASVTIPSTVKKIGAVAFYMCSSLRDVTLPEGLEVIGSGAFESCYYLNVTLPESLTTLESYALGAVRGMSEIVIPANVTYIGEAALSGEFSKITFNGAPPEFDENAFRYTEAEVYYPNDGTWPESVRQSYGGTVTWVPYGDADNDEEITITVNTTAGSVTAPEGGWKEGANTFTVTAEKPCVVVVSYDGGATYTRLTASATGVDNTYSFTANDMTESSIVAVIMTGDTNGDGAITNADVTRLKVAYQNKVKLDSLKWLAADVNNSGDITNADVTRLKAVYQNKTEFSW